MTVLEKKLTKNIVDHRIKTGLQKQFDKNQQTANFHNGYWESKDYYVRHLLETVLRIRLNNETDAYVLYRLGWKDDYLAKKLAHYLAEEYGHENMFTRDLRQLGLTDEIINNTNPFRSTSALMGFIKNSVDQAGPAPSTIWNYIVEFYSDTYNQLITNAAKEKYGEHALLGSQAHLDIDEKLDHDGLMWDVVSHSVTRWLTPTKALYYIDIFTDFIGDYFNELAQNQF